MIRWPDRYQPGRAPVHVRNTIDVPTPPDRVWAWPVRATLGPTRCSNASNVVIDGGAPDLAPSAGFRRKSFGISLTSRVEEFAPPERLAWTGRSFGVDVHHAWLISATSAGCNVLTEESQFGFLARLDHAFRPRRTESRHQVWLESLRSKAAAGSPPAV